MALSDNPQTAKRLKISQRKLDQLVRAGELRAVKIGRRRLFRDVDLDQFEANLPACRPPASEPAPIAASGITP